MDINNNNEINKMFGTEDAPVTPPTSPELQTSPLGGSSTPGKSPFDSDLDAAGGDSTRIPTGIDVSETAADVINANNIAIGDHSGFKFAKQRSGGAGRALLVIIPLMLIIGAFAGGFAVHTYFFGFEVSAEHSAAVTAMESVFDDISPVEKIIFTDAFVNNKTNEFESIVFAVIEDNPTEFRTAVFRVVEDKRSNNIDVFYEFDEDEFERLSDSGNDRDSIEAQFLLNLNQEFERCLAEIRDNRKNWVNIDPSYISARINSK